MESKAKATISYTENELKAIEILKANAGNPLSAKDLGIAVAVLTSLVKKATDPRPMTEGVERVIVHKEDYNAVCQACGAKISHKLYYVDAE